MKDFAFSHLPKGYELYEIVDLTGGVSSADSQKSADTRKTASSAAVAVNANTNTNTENGNVLKNLAITGLALTVCMILWGIFVVKIPLAEAFDMSAFRIIFAFLGMIMGLVVYIFIHEGVHGFFIKMFSGQAPFYGKNLKAGMFYAGSHCFFGKTAYIVIALAPFVVWGTVLAMLLSDLAVSAPQFWWYLYAIQIFNFTGAVGDLYMTWRTLQMPKGVLVQDDGTMMRFYVPQKQQDA